MDEQETVAASRRKRPVMGHSTGAATHNASPEPGDLEVTVWGRSDTEPDRVVAVVLTEDAVRRLLTYLRRYGF